MHFTGYHHAQISVAPGQAEAVRQFYGKLLGMPEIAVPDILTGRGLIWFAVGDRELHVAVEDNINRLATSTHLAYEVADVAALRQHLLDAGYALIEQPRLSGYDRFHLTDPFGNRVEFIGSEPIGKEH